MNNDFRNFKLIVLSKTSGSNIHKINNLLNHILVARELIIKNKNKKEIKLLKNIINEEKMKIFKLIDTYK